VVAVSFVVVATASCGGDDSEEATIPTIAATMKLGSPAFPDDGNIPREFTCDGEDVSPPLAWNGAPAGTAAFVIVADDPDAGSFVHWLLYNIPPDIQALPKAASPGEGAKEGLNSFKQAGYGGPCPPAGKSHHYRFRIYALDAPLELERGATREDLERAMRGHILARGELVGRYQRQ
jgi:Raf kinase inhibitor-like YbhB/YbcL family protein